MVQSLRGRGGEGVGVIQMYVSFFLVPLPFVSCGIFWLGWISLLFWPYANANRIIDNSQTLRFVHLSTRTPLSSKLGNSSEVTWNAIWPLISCDGVSFSSPGFSDMIATRDRGVINYRPYGITNAAHSPEVPKLRLISPKKLTSISSLVCFGYMKVECIMSHLRCWSKNKRSLGMSLTERGPVNNSKVSNLVWCFCPLSFSLVVRHQPPIWRCAWGWHWHGCWSQDEDGNRRFG